MFNNLKSQIINLAGLVVGLVALNATIYGQFDEPKTGTIFVLGILGFIALYFIVSYLIANLLEQLNQIKYNTESIFELREDLNKLNDDINMIKDTAKLNARVSFLEKRLLK